MQPGLIQKSKSLFSSSSPRALEPNRYTSSTPYFAAVFDTASQISSRLKSDEAVELIIFKITS